MAVIFEAVISPLALIFPEDVILEKGWITPLAITIEEVSE